jgi:two-component system, OmpR family, response regulator
MTSILLIDEDMEFVSQLAEYLEKEGFWVHIEAEATRGVASAGNYGFVILDSFRRLRMLQSIREQSSLPVLILTTREDDAERILALEMGADDYVAKPCTARELLARIRAILRRTRSSASIHTPFNAVVSGSLAMWPEQRRAERRGKPLPLTSTEFSLLEVLLREVGRPVSKDELSERALGRPHAPRDRSVDVHLSSIRQKLGTLSDGRPLIQTIHRRGYLLLKE